MEADKKKSMIDKILKLLEIGKEDNGAYSAERESANNMAAKLMADYAIDFSDLRSAPKKSDMRKEEVKPLDETEVCKWESALAGCIADAFDCQVVTSTRNNWDGKKWWLNFIGTKTDLEISVFFYRHLVRTVCRKSELEFRGKRDQEAYAHGMVATISSRLKDLYKRRQEVMQSDSRALVIVKTDAVEAYKNELFPKLTKGRGQKISNPEAYRKGVSDGHSVSLNRPIQGGGPKKQIH